MPDEETELEIVTQGSLRDLYYVLFRRRWRMRVLSALILVAMILGGFITNGTASQGKTLTDAKVEADIKGRMGRNSTRPPEKSERASEGTKVGQAIPCIIVGSLCLLVIELFIVKSFRGQGAGNLVKSQAWKKD